MLELGTLLGKGGQGEVYRVKGGKRVVKLLHKGSGERMRRQFATVKRMDLRGIHVAKPLSLLKPPLVGYVAEFLDGMIPLSALIAPQESLAESYIASGGVRRRLRLLAHLGEVLLALHSKGLIYGDISHHNVFVSQDPNFNEVWLIDLDNLTCESDPARTIYTPGFGAPEVVKGLSGNTSLSDVWAFAVLVWQTLTLNHPFIGDMVNEGEPELEEAAMRGEVPWVGHLEDDSNQASSGIPSEMVFGTKLMELAKQTFEDGVNNRLNRPGIAKWVEVLHATADQTVLCRNCGGTFLANNRECSWCDTTRPNTSQITIRRWDPEKKKFALSLGKFAISANEPVTLTERSTRLVSGVGGRTPHVTIHKVDRGYKIMPESDSSVWVMDPHTKETFEVKRRGQTVGEDGWILFFEPRDHEQRVAVLGGK
jgi:DNA-binding helix-hairpin-helix protein with protein kinase domain